MQKCYNTHTTYLHLFEHLNIKNIVKNDFLHTFYPYICIIQKVFVTLRAN